jgi:hypothetical protein
MVLNDHFTRTLPYINTIVRDNNPNFLFVPNYHNHSKTIP